MHGGSEFQKFGHNKKLLPCIIVRASELRKARTTPVRLKPDRNGQISAKRAERRQVFRLIAVITKMVITDKAPSQINSVAGFSVNPKSDAPVLRRNTATALLGIHTRFLLCGTEIQYNAPVVPIDFL